MKTLISFILYLICASAWPQCSPILIDTRRDGIELGPAGRGVSFDVNADGFPDHVQWVRRGGDEARATVSLDSVIAALQREWQPAFEQARRSVRVHGERGLVVQAKPVDLSQVLSTLLENALAHGRGTVDVHARRSGPSVVVEVSDQGEGVPASIAPHIFERSVTTTGTGLGLALARDLAESNGGRLELIQAQPAIFALFLSESDEGALIGDVKPSQQPPGRGTLVRRKLGSALVQVMWTPPADQR